MEHLVFRRRRSKMAASVRRLCCLAHTCVQQSTRPFSLSPGVQAGQKWRLEHGMAKTGSEYGPLTDLPDWSFADGRPAPVLKGQQRRKQEREQFARRVVALSTEVDKGMQRWREKQEEAIILEEKRKSQLLKPKGKLLLKCKK